MKEINLEEIDLEDTSKEDLLEMVKNFEGESKEYIKKVGELEGLIQKHKKTAKSNKAVKEIEHEDLEEMSTRIKNETKSEILADNFYKSNPDLVEFKDEINKFIKAGFSYEKASTYVKGHNETYLERQKADSINIEGGQGGGGDSKKTYSQEDISKLSPREQVKIYDRVNRGEIIIK